jgi:hypothetical protein
VTEPTGPPPRAAKPTEEPPLQRMATQIDHATPDGAAFLDGLSDDDLALFAEALAIQRELEAEHGIVVEEPQDEEVVEPEPVPELAKQQNVPVLVAAEAAPEIQAAEPVADVLPFRPRGRQSISPAWRVLAAAAVVLVVVTPFLSRWAGGRAIREPSDAVAELAMRTLPDGYDDNRPFDLTRSDNDDLITEEGRAVQVGVYIVDLRIAISQGNQEATELMSARAAGLLNGAAGTASREAGRAFEQIGARARAGGEPKPLIEELDAATDIAQETVDPDYLALGAWAEAALIAASQDDAAFFRSDRIRGTLSSAEKLLEDNAEAQAPLASIRAGLESEELNLPNLKQAFLALLGAIT